MHILRQVRQVLNGRWAEISGHWHNFFLSFLSVYVLPITHFRLQYHIRKKHWKEGNKQRLWLSRLLWLSFHWKLYQRRHFLFCLFSFVKTLLTDLLLKSADMPLPPPAALFAFKSFYLLPQVLDIILLFYSFSFKCIFVNGICPPVCKENRIEQCLLTRDAPNTR